MLWRALKDVENGFYIDVGAADPDYFSVTSLFYRNGWRGINLEPSKTHHDRLRLQRPRDTNLRIAVDETSGVRSFFEIADSGLSTLERSVAEKHEQGQLAVREITVACRTLAEICDEYVVEKTIHFLKIDVEGGEERVLRGADFNRHRPWIVVVEATQPMSQTPDHERWEHLLVDNGYIFAWFDGLNRFYVAQEYQTRLLPHFQSPPNVFDGFLRAADVLDRVSDDQKAAEQRATKAETLVSQLAGEAHDLRNRLDQAERTTALTIERLVTQIASMSEAHGTQMHGALEELRIANERAEAAIERHDPQIEARLRDAQEGRDAAERWNAAVRASTSWRLTRPLRGVMYLLRGRVSPKDALKYLWSFRPLTLRTEASVPSNGIDALVPSGLHPLGIASQAGAPPVTPPSATAHLSPGERHLYRVLSQRIRSA